ncbi:MAG: ThaI family type II restriction endonuclease [Leptospiraceae bacterium]|nr:ThaI family type II restriction endonuclease [Leptospiraceae bacterium]MCK6382504.1 ThaI family type II restriction endonuclease [Leptospiraceae bacterium]NUM42943.1 ThaI family type II restriction endonuclease [Leptospiraceae bacterium]
MSLKYIDEYFEDPKIIQKVKEKLSVMFQVAELESSRAGRVGMEVGSIRERIIISLLMTIYGKEEIETEIPITESEIDVKVLKKPISIKTITGLTGIKVLWTVDSKKAKEYLDNYQPTCDLILALIKWKRKSTDHPGGLYFIPLRVQKEILKRMGAKQYLKLPKKGTNPRGIELSKKALIELLQHQNTKCITVYWEKEKLDYDIYLRWMNKWQK